MYCFFMDLNWTFAKIVILTWNEPTEVVHEPYVDIQIQIKQYAWWLCDQISILEILQ